MKIHAQPCLPPTPSMRIMAVASRPEKAPASELDAKKTAMLLRIEKHV